MYHITCLIFYLLNNTSLYLNRLDINIYHLTLLIIMLFNLLTKRPLELIIHEINIKILIKYQY